MQSDRPKSIESPLKREILSWLDSGSYRERALVRNIAKTTRFERDEVRTALTALAGTDRVEYHPESGLYRRSDRH